ncbi:hypothetical protein LPC08_23400 [Roseomonas sp. OT10]|uniref:hypothetical protein n=1 Tax=Roseomonas cutis TaxID=2897332 RepID=UPI001E470CB6|nr:hypothetical protein [Roseomonas sp. OT10]UFN48125.1 hypothetical protein LPC08_19215 [Roseomonas sp. OT10]UFN48907.1 hypothetical protein LPC08_23400 [Roseomonas sp. OT10]
MSTPTPNAKDAFNELDRRLLEIGSGLHALQEIATTGDFRRGSCPEADQLQGAIEWVTARLMEQVVAANTYAEEQARAQR